MDESFEETITRISDLDSSNSYTVARVLENNKCVELHYSEGRVYLEYGKKVAEDLWENEISEDVEWFSLDLTDKEVLVFLNKEYDEHFQEKELDLDYEY